MAQTGSRSSPLSSAVLRSHRDQLQALVDDGIPAEFLAGALLGASARAGLASRTPELVWSGPDVGGGTGRFTPSAVVDLLAGATSEVLLVGYAVHEEPRVSVAVQAAASRGVQITFLLERSRDNPGYRGPRAPFASVEARRLCWPADQRPAGASLHAKLLVVDRRAALVGSANITGAALDVNLECGVVLHGPDAARLHGHIDALFEEGHLQQV